MTFKPARKRFGQNFLVDDAAVRRIVEALAPAPGDPVLEIGPGRGALTSRLIERAGRIAAIELDRDLAEYLRERFAEDSLALVEGDVLRVPLDEVAAALGCDSGDRLLVAGNLPYNIAKPVVQKLVRERRRIRRAVLMFQREVAARLTASPGSRDFGPITVLTALTYEIRPLFHLPPGAFRPRPKVESTVTVWEPLPDSPLTEAAEPGLRTCLRAAFGRRRQTLRNNLRSVLPDRDAVDAALAGAGLDGALRAERLAPEDFLRLAAAWPVDPRHAPNDAV